MQPCIVSARILWATTVVLLADIALVATLMAGAHAAEETEFRRAWTPRVGGSYGTMSDAVLAGELHPEPATPSSLAIRWPIRGDRNGNAEVEVSYRKAGSNSWLTALPLFWIHPEKAPPDFQIPGGRLFAGSIVNLDPDTAYEVRFDLADPDGGSESRTLRLHTTREPLEPIGLRVIHVAPAKPEGPIIGGGSASAKDPVIGLGAALQLARAGDLLLLGPGIYHVGGLKIPRSGQPGRPIIIRGVGSEHVVLDGGGGPILLDASDREHVWFERLSFRNADLLLRARQARHIVIRRNRFAVGSKKLSVGVEGRKAQYDEAVGFFITDNIFVGPNKWPRKTRRKSKPDFLFGIALTGAGHMIAYNTIRNLGDGINNGRGGLLSASDIHNNDVYDNTDDCIEADHSATNLRVFRNRLTNCSTGVSLQPVHGGPVYVFRNLILNTRYSPFKLHNHTSGVMLFHNTSVKYGIPFLIRPARETVNDVITRNNIFVGTSGPALRSTGRMIRTDFDNDGYGYNGKVFAIWNRKTYRSAYAARSSGQLYARHGAVDLFYQGGFANGLRAPADWRQRLDPAANDFRLKPGARAVDRGVRLANFNDGFAGSAPDLGCCELGAPLPHFGPRPDTLPR